MAGRRDREGEARMSKLHVGREAGAGKASATLVADFFVENGEQLQHPVLRRFDDMWRARAEHGLLPGRQHMAHDDLVDLLPHLMMLEVSGEGDRLRFRARLVGQHHVDINGGNSAGQFVDEAGNNGRIGCVEQEALIDVTLSRTPLYSRYELDDGSGETLTCETALYPLASDGTNVDRIAAVIVPHYPAYARRMRLFSWF